MKIINCIDIASPKKYNPVMYGASIRRDHLYKLKKYKPNTPITSLTIKNGYKNNNLIKTIPLRRVNKKQRKVNLSRIKNNI